MIVSFDSIKGSSILRIFSYYLDLFYLMYFRYSLLFYQFVLWDVGEMDKQIG